MIEFLLLRTLLALAVMLVMTIWPVRPLVSVALSCPQFVIHRRFSPTYYYIRGIFHASFFWKGLVSGLILFLPPGILSSYSTQDSWTPAFQGQILRLRTLLPEDQDGLALSALCHTCLLWDRRMATASFSSSLVFSSLEKALHIWVSTSFPPTLSQALLSGLHPTLQRERSLTKVTSIAKSSGSLWYSLFCFLKPPLRPLGCSDLAWLSFPAALSPSRAAFSKLGS